MLTLFSLFIINSAMAFPEMLRHHYINCSACHVSNSGGGVLNAYGRSISSELLSTWGTQKEARPFYTMESDKIGQWLNMGGDVRSVQVHQETNQFKKGRSIWMEANIQAAISIQKLTSFVSVGQVQQPNQSWKAETTKYYFSFQQSDELALRVGHYIPTYGLNIPQHTFLIKQNLFFGPGSERNSADLQWNGEKWNFLLGISKSSLNSSVRDEEQAYNFQIQRTIADQYKIGFSQWYGDATNYRKLISGVHTVLGWTEKFYTLAELDHMWTKDNSNVETKSIAQLLKFGYEMEKGLHLQFVEEWGTSSTSDINNLGLGFIWYPRPHFELEGLYSKRQITTTTDSTEDYAYLVTHFYF